MSLLEEDRDLNVIQIVEYYEYVNKTVHVLAKCHHREGSVCLYVCVRACVPECEFSSYKTQKNVVRKTVRIPGDCWEEHEG
jgi:hypothetical protein